VQYLAPIIKNRQYNFLPVAQNVFVGATTRPNELTYSEDWMRPDYIPPQPPPGAVPSPGGPPLGAEAAATGGNAAPPPPGPPIDTGGPPLAAEAAATGGSPIATNPADGLTGMMVPPGPTREQGRVGP
jgi:phospholipid/cholesterol/gamma-HCH transport system substrate-binding protein